MTDALRQQAMAADPALNAFVMANAGSGKTRTLVDRVGRLLLAGAAPGAVLCLTFTKAAASEMQQRLFERLGAWAVASDDDLRAALAALEQRGPDSLGAQDLRRARQLFARALETPGGLKIQTIHAFCEQLLRRFPLEAGVSPSFTAIDEAEAQDLRAEARDLVLELGRNHGHVALSEAFERLSVRLGHPGLVSLFADIEAARDALHAQLEAAAAVGGIEAQLMAAFDIDTLSETAVLDEAFGEDVFDAAAWEAGGKALSGCAGANDQAQGARMLAVLAHLSEAPDLAEAFAAALDIFFTKAGEERKSLMNKPAAAALPNVLELLTRESVRFERLRERVGRIRTAAVTRDVLVLAQAYLAVFRELKDARGLIDFGDQIAHARNLLTRRGGAAWVLYKLDGGIEHILVDEAQDTSPAQWDIIRALSSEFFAGQGVREDDRRTLFVVGDEKQSIFSFQGAAPERLLEEAQGYQVAVEASGRTFKSVGLLSSWRSTPEILAFVDRVFNDTERARALSPGGLVDRRDTPRHDARRVDAGTIDIWPLEREQAAEARDAWAVPDAAHARDSAVRTLARKLAREIKAMVTRGEQVFDRESGEARAATYGDVMVLVSKRGTMFETLLREMKRESVPVAGSDRLKLAAHPCYLDLIALGRAALSPTDDLTLAGVLRSPLCDVSEEALFRLAHDRGSMSLWERMATLKPGAHGLGPEDVEALGRARDLITWFQGEARSCAAFELYGRLLSRRDGSGLTCRQRFVTRIGIEAEDALNAFLDLVRARESRAITDLERTLAELSRIAPELKREMEESHGRVRVMTAHASKGLEAPIVILPDMLARARGGARLLLDGNGHAIWKLSDAEARCEQADAAKEREKLRAEQESLRLLYVGLTRARDRLVLAAAAGVRDAGEGGWWGAVQEAAAGAREATSASGIAIRRIGAEPGQVAARAKESLEPAALPDWLELPARAEQARSYSAPSRLDGDDDDLPAPSPLARSMGLDRFRRGILIHRLLERLADVPGHERQRLGERMLAREPGVSEAAREEMIGAALGVMDDARFAHVFGPGSRAEVPLVGRSEALPEPMLVSARIDRLVITPERVLAVDFKTQRPAPESESGVDQAAITQLAVYGAVLAELFPRREIATALLFTDGPRLIEIGAHTRQAALERLRQIGRESGKD